MEESCKLHSFILCLSLYAAVQVGNRSHPSEIFIYCKTINTAGVSSFWAYGMRGMHANTFCLHRYTVKHVYMVKLTKAQVKCACVVSRTLIRPSFYIINNRCHGVSSQLNYSSARMSWKWGWRDRGLILALYNLQCKWEVSKQPKLIRKHRRDSLWKERATETDSEI